MIRYCLSSLSSAAGDNEKRSRFSILTLAASVAALTLVGTQASAQLATPEKESLAAPRAPVPGDVVSQTAGLRVTPTFVGRSEDGKQLTISALIENVSDKTVGLALIPPWPQAVDNAGSSYQSAGFAGTGVCQTRSEVNYCFENYSHYLPKHAFTILTPGGRITAVYTFTLAGGRLAKGGKGSMISFSSTFAMKEETKPGSGLEWPEKDGGDRGLRTVTISFPNLQVPEA